MPYPDIQRRSRRGRTPYGGGTSVLTRYFTDYDSSLQSYDEFSTPFVLTGDFRIRIKHATSLTNSRALLGRKGTSDDILYTDTNQLRFRAAGGTFHSFGVAPGGIVLSDNALHTTEIVRTGTTVSATTDGVPHTSTITEAGVFTFDVSARFGSTGYWGGQLADLEIEDAGTLVGDFPLDEGPDSTIRINRAAVLGSEEWVYPLTLDGSVGLFGILGGVASGGVAMNTKFQVEFSWVNLTGRGILRVGEAQFDTGNQTNNTGSASTTIADSASLDRLFVENAAVSTTADSMTISVKEIPAATPYATRFNQPASQDNLFAQVSDGWEGEELWTFGGYSFTGSETQFSNLIGDINNPNISAGNVYRYSWQGELSGGDASSQARLRIGNASVSTVTGSEGQIFSLSGSTIVMSNDDLYVQAGVDPQFEAGSTIADISVKRFLEEA